MCSIGYNIYCFFSHLDEVKIAPGAIFTSHESFASSRGYIWSRTIPLLKETLFIGTGADTFVIAFPQDDYIGKINSGYSFAFAPVTKKLATTPLFFSPSKRVAV